MEHWGQIVPRHIILEAQKRTKNKIKRLLSIIELLSYNFKKVK